MPNTQLTYLHSVNMLGSLVYTAQTNTEKGFVTTFKCYTSCYTVTATWFGGSPVFLRATGDSSGAERSEVRSIVTSIKQTGQGPE